MNEEKKKRGRPPKIFTAETDGMTYEGAINYALDRQVKSELDKTLSGKDESQLTDEERKYLDSRRENKTRTLNIRFTESEYQEIISKCQQYGYKKKSEYVRDCVRARVPSAVQQVDLSETNRQLKAIGNNINQVAVRLHSTGNFYAEDMTEIKRGVNQIWQLLISIQSKLISAEQSHTLSTKIRPGTDYMYHLIFAGQTAEVRPRILPKPDSENGKLMTPTQLTEKAQDLINEYNALVDIHNAQATKISVANKYVKDIHNNLTKKRQTGRTLKTVISVFLSKERKISLNSFQTNGKALRGV